MQGSPIAIYAILFLLINVVHTEEDLKKLVCWRNSKTRMCQINTIERLRDNNDFVRTYRNEMCISMAVGIPGHCNLCYKRVHPPQPLCDKMQCACRPQEKGPDRVRKTPSTLYLRHMSCTLDYFFNKQRRPNYLKNVPMSYCNGLNGSQWRNINERCSDLPSVD